MKDIKRSCIYCDKVIRSGRSDKKFCDERCKDAYYNSIKIQEHNEIKKIDLILKKNRRVLKKLFNLRNATIPKSILVKEGFEFDYHTHIIITKLKRNQFIFCYDHGYREVADGRIQIIRSFA